MSDAAFSVAWYFGWAVFWTMLMAGAASVVYLWAMVVVEVVRIACTIA